MPPINPRVKLNILKSFAALAYFGHSAAELTPEEAAALAAALPSPRRYSPAKGARFMEKRKNRIVSRMRASGYLPDEADEEYMNESLETIISSAAPAVEAPMEIKNPAYHFKASTSALP